MPVRLSLLGGFDTAATGLPVKARALLAYLALRPGTFHLRDKLTALFWPDVDDLRARDSLRQVVAALRKSCRDDGAPVLVERDHAFAVRPELLDVDVLRFERLAASDEPADWHAAADCYRGDLLEGLAVNAPAFEEWLLLERARLRETAIDTLARLLAAQTRAAARSTDDAAEAARTAMRLLALDPLQEPVHRTLMRLLAEHGRHAAALRQYQTCVDVLRHELGVEPEPETRRTYEAILQRRIGAPTPAAEVLREAPLAQGDAPALFDRHRELRAIREAADAISASTGRALLFAGDAGIGKTALLDAAIAELSPLPSLVLSGRSHASTQVLPFGPWIEALRAGGIARGTDVVEALAPVWRGELSRLLPELAGPDPVPSGGDSFALFEAVAQLLEVLARARAVVVTLEDLHWADESSVRLLAFVANRIAASPIVLVATARVDGTPGPALAAALTDLERAPHCVVLRPAPLSRAAVAQLTGRHLRTGSSSSQLAAAAEQAWTISRGNPYVATEILRSLAEIRTGDGDAPLPVSHSVRDVIARRLDGLSAGAARLVAIAAIVQRDFDFPFVQAASGMPALEAAEAMEEIVRRGVIHATEEGFRFVHDSVREVAAGGILPARREVLHAHVAAALEERHAADPGPAIAELAFHFEAAGAWRTAAGYLRRAGQVAAAQSAYHDAADFFRRAVAALRRAPSSPDGVAEEIDGLIDLRHMLLPLGDLDGALGCLDEAEALARRHGDDRRLGRIACHRTQFFWAQGELAAAIECGERARTLGESSGDVAIRAEAQFFLGSLFCASGDYGRAAAILEHNVAMLAGPLATEHFGLAFLPSSASLSFLAWALAERGFFDEALVRARQMAAIADAAGHPFEQIGARNGPGLVLLRRGDFHAAAEILAPAVELCRSLRAPILFPFVASHLGLALAHSGRAPEGAGLLREVVAQAEAMHLAIYRSRWIGMLGEALLAAGHVDDASRAAGAACELARHREEAGHEAWALRLQGTIAAVRGAGDEAQRCYQAGAALAARLEMRPLAAIIEFEQTLLATGTASPALEHAGMAGWTPALSGFFPA